ncbi:glycine decarboxylase subunit P [Savitreella phatthalungensis]
MFSPYLRCARTTSARLLSKTTPGLCRRLALFSNADEFLRRHIGPREHEESSMLNVVGHDTFESFISATIPADVRAKRDMPIPDAPVNERTLLLRLKGMMSKNQCHRSFIGLGYYGTITPPVILRNVLENPAWYTSYTPYQPEISQGRLESLFNYQTLVSELTRLPMTNASLLDEGTAAAEAMIMVYSASKMKRKTFFVDASCHKQTIACVCSRAVGFGIKVVVGNANQIALREHEGSLCGVLLQYPSTDGNVADLRELSSHIHSLGAQVVVATDLLALTILSPPGEWGADIAVGNSQRLGVPLGFGGPHAAFFACTDEHKRRMPGRIVGLSIDSAGDPAFRLALQTREQHIRREKATSNICTAQALLANMAAMYACYHGPDGLKRIAERITSFTAILAFAAKSAGHEVKNAHFFDTLTIKVDNAQSIHDAAYSKGINLRQVDERHIGVSLDETVSPTDLEDLVEVISGTRQSVTELAEKAGISDLNPHHPRPALRRTTPYLQQKEFQAHRSETELLRYIHLLQSRDLSLTHSMIPLGSCTMKLNATTEMIPVSWPEVNNLHPFIPREQATGYMEMLHELETDLATITGFDAVSLQPNSGAQGEYAGLRVIKAFHEANGQMQRDICLIPVSAHGTNPASATMCGMKVVAVKCHPDGNLDMEDLNAKAVRHADRLAAFMVTYPSTFGVFEPAVKAAIRLIHENGGQVYMDGANMNAQVGLCSPGEIGADVCHLNLHKTFCIPHGGGGPGMGPIGVKAHLADFLPSHPIVACTQSDNKAIEPISAAPWGSASILPISWAYIKLLGSNGLTHATRVALLNANYMRAKLAPHYKVRFVNEHGNCAHEFILDIKELAASAGIEVIDIAKRLQDYGFHAPTMSWPVSTGLMIEPTESESIAEMDRFCEALISIRHEIAEIADGRQPRSNNLLKNAPHTLKACFPDDNGGADWNRPYSTTRAAFPLPYLRHSKFWPSVGRLDDKYGDVNLCTCTPLQASDAE